jgi:hypothetical protein
MMLRGSSRLVVLACALTACTSDRADVPGAPVSGVTQVRSGDSGTSTAADSGETSPRDAGTRDAAVPATSCVPVPVLAGGAEDSLMGTATEQPGDLVVTRQAETWIADCTNPKLVLDFSDGVCPSGLGHDLSISFALNSIADGLIHSGNNEIEADADSKGIQIRYTRPLRLTPNGTWGTCANASGQLIFLEAPDPAPGVIWQARYELTLTPCDGSMAAPQMVVGALKMVLHYGIDQFCPTRSM